MNDLKENSIIKLTDGKKVKVGRMLGQGAQGTVYRVEMEGQSYALKWYKQLPSENFVNNLKRNVMEGSPSPQFLWPLGVTRQIKGSQGYIMPLKPEGFYEFSKFRLAKVRFNSLLSILNAAISTCNAFKLLHSKGLSFQDINDGGLFINPSDGQVLICDCDNVFPHGDHSGILGKARYVAPEVVVGKKLPDSYSDRFSMCVLLFMFFCVDHPFEGANVLRYPCLTEAIEQQLFGNDICFIFDKDNPINKPVRNIHKNAINLWKLMPERIKTVFQEEFSKSKIFNPESRRTEMQWIDILSEVRDLLTHCPHCNDEVIADGKTPCLNPNCLSTYTSALVLSAGKRKIPIGKGTRIFTNDVATECGKVLMNPSDKNMFIKNVSATTWTVTTPKGKQISVPSGNIMPAREGLKISIINNNQKFEYTITQN